MKSYDDDFEPGLPSEEQEALIRLATRVRDERPVPSPRFRGDLRRRLVAADAQGVRHRLFGTRPVAIGSLVVGAALLLIAGVGLADAGPLAPSQAGDAVASLLAML